MTDSSPVRATQPGDDGRRCMFEVLDDPYENVDGEWLTHPCGLPAEYVAEYEVRDDDEWPSMPFGDLCEAHAQRERQWADDVGLIRLTSLMAGACRG